MELMTCCLLTDASHFGIRCGPILATIPSSATDSGHSGIRTVLLMSITKSCGPRSLLITVSSTSYLGRESSDCFYSWHSGSQACNSLCELLRGTSIRAILSLCGCYSFCSATARLAYYSLTFRSPLCSQQRHCLQF